MKVRLWLQIGQQMYRVIPQASHPEVSRKAWRLVKGGTGEVYDVHLTAHGPACDCKGGTYSTPKSGKPCKHVRALASLKLIPEVI